MSNGVIFPFLIMIIFTKEWVICDNRFCDMWKETVKIVRICPSNETKIENKNKNCLKYAEKAHLNNCIDYTKIRYHCVLNSHGNQTIEVCAPEKRINGFCAEFNEEAGEILPNHYLDCSLFTPPCRSHYNSPDAYLYENCYNHSNNEIVIKRNKYGEVTTQIQPRNVSPGVLPSISYLPNSSKLIEPIQTITIVCIVILTIVTVTLFGKLPKWSKYLIDRSKHCKRNRTEEGDDIELQEMNVSPQN